VAEAGLAHEQVRMGESLGLDLRSELIQGSRVPDDAGKRISHDSEA
jgi:hypothetical protein